MAKVTKSGTSKATKAALPFHKFFNVSRVSTATGIQKDKLYYRLNGRYNTWSPEDEAKIEKVLVPAIKEFMSLLGLEITVDKTNQ